MVMDRLTIKGEPTEEEGSRVTTSQSRENLEIQKVTQKLEAIEEKQY